EWRTEKFEVRIPVELKSVTGLHSDVYWRHEIAPRFDIPFEVCNARVLVFEKLLPYPAKSSVLTGSRLPVANSPQLPRPRARQEAQLGIERIAIVVERVIAIPQIIGVIDLVSPALTLAPPNIAFCPRCPSSNKKVFVPLEC